MPGSFLDRDLENLFASSEFGEADGSVTRNGVSLGDNPGIFDDEDVEVQMGEGVAQMVPRLMLTTASSKVPGIAEGDLIVIRGVTRTVKYWEEDGTGMIEIFMENEA